MHHSHQVAPEGADSIEVNRQGEKVRGRWTDNNRKEA